MTSLTGICPQCQLTETLVDPEFVAGLLGAEVSAGFGSMCMACGALVTFSGSDDVGRPVYATAVSDVAAAWAELSLVGRARDAIDLTDRRSPVLALHLMLVLTNGAHR